MFTKSPKSVTQIVSEGSAQMRFLDRKNFFNEEKSFFFFQRFVLRLLLDVIETANYQLTIRHQTFLQTQLREWFTWLSSELDSLMFSCTPTQAIWLSKLVITSGMRLTNWIGTNAIWETKSSFWWLWFGHKECQQLRFRSFRFRWKVIFG